jgi:hypothetical protein
LNRKTISDNGKRSEQCLGQNQCEATANWLSPAAENGSWCRHGACDERGRAVTVSTYTTVARPAVTHRRLQGGVSSGARTLEWRCTSRELRWTTCLTGEAGPRQGGGGGGGRQSTIDGGGDRWVAAVQEVSYGTVEEG